MRVEVLHEAELDLLDGYRFYQNQSDGLGDYFLDSLLADLESLRIYAGVHSQRFGYHRMLSKRFPFAIYYLVENRAARVYAVVDCRRDTTWTQDRLM